MAKKSQNRFSKPAAVSTPFEEARDELFQHIMRCGVIGAEPDDQKVWFDETMTYMTERYYDLSKEQLDELRVLGERFARPAKAQSSTSAA